MNRNTFDKLFTAGDKEKLWEAIQPREPVIRLPTGWKWETYDAACRSEYRSLKDLQLYSAYSKAGEYVFGEDWEDDCVAPGVKRDVWMLVRQRNMQALAKTK